MAFSFRAGTNWCHDFPKLARESGFYFNMHGSRVRVDWNRISAIDIDRVIRERDFSTIDENINNVIDYCLENEYDVKILDSNFVKLFRLAQLSVEYLLYCKQYLDHSVIILKDELRQKIEQNVNMKKEITTLEDTIKSLKEKTKEKCKLIEARLGDSSGEIYKCPHCPKTFVSAMFVNAHVARRHSYISDIHVSTSPMHEHYRAETEKLHNEIKTLKERLNQTERIIRNESDKLLNNTEDYVRNMSKNEYNITKVDRFQEQKRYQEDIGSFKSMLFDEIRALREKEHTANENIVESNVKTLISQQEKEIESLRSQLLERLTPGIESMQMKLQMQENYWKGKIEDMETQHHKDIERLTMELKATQQTADNIKSEYASKVNDLEKQSMDQSNILVEQGKQLNCLSREISNSQTQSNNHKTIEKGTIEKLLESSSLKIKRDNILGYDNTDPYHKNLNSINNGEMIIEDIGSASSQEYSDKLVSRTVQNKYIPDRKNTIKKKDIKKFITDITRTAEHAPIKSNLQTCEKSEIIEKTKDKIKHYDISKDVDETDDHASKIFSPKNLKDVSVTKKYVETRNVEKTKTVPINDVKKNKKFEFIERHSISSITEFESSSSISQSESDSESITAEDDVTVKKYEISAIKSPISRKISIQEDARNMFNNRLRDLGIDPEWQGIPMATFKQTMEIVKHQQNINAKKLIQYSRIKQKILEDVLQIISTNRKDLGHISLTKKSPLDKLITHVRSKASKTLSSHKDNEEYISMQKTENTTPSKLRLKQQIELLPTKYKNEEIFVEDTRESPLRKSGTDIYTSPKMKLIQSRSIADRYRRTNRDISSTSSIENSPENVKQISSTKITVLDSSARKVGSPINRKQVEAASKFFVNNDSDNTIVQQEDTVLSPKNNKSVLKLTSGSVSSLVKKKVFFDLEGEKDNGIIPANDQRKSQMNDNDWNISSFAEERGYTLQKEKSMSTGNIVLKTSQSDKIAEISKKIQEQLSIVKKPPVGSVETIFRSNMSSHDQLNYNAKNQLLNSTSLASTSEDLIQNFTSPKARGSLFPQPAPRTLKDKDFAIAQYEKELSVSKYSDLDSDIDEILQME